MNVHFVINAYPPSVGGAQIHTRALATELAAQGHHVRVSALSRTTDSDWIRASTAAVNRTSAAAYEDGVEVVTLGMPRRSQLDPVWRRLYLPLRRSAARHFARQIDYSSWGDAVHVVRLGREHLALRAAEQAAAVGVPLVLTPNHHPRWSGWRPDPVWRQLYRSADLVVALTQVEARMLAALGVDEGRIAVTGIGPVLPADRSVLDDTEREPYVLFLGQQFPYKRVDVAIETLRRLAADGAHNDLRLVIAGSITDETRAAVSRSGLADRVELRHRPDDREKLALLSRAQLLLFPSEQESFGGVLVEAAAVGTPFVARGIPQIREVTTRLGWGVVADAGEDFAAATDRLLRTPPSMAERRAAAERANTTFGWPQLARDYGSLYEKVVSSR